MDKDGSKLKLAIDATCIAPGGGLVVLLNYLRAWRRLDLPLAVAVFASRSAVAQALRKIEGVEVIEFHVDQSPTKVFVLRQLALRRRIERLRPDCLLAHNTTIRKCKVPQIVFHQGQWTLIAVEFFRWWKAAGLTFALATWYRHRAVVKSIRTADCNVYISRYLMELARCWVPDSYRNNYVIHNGVLLPERPEGFQQRQLDRPRPPHLVAIQPVNPPAPYPHKDNPTLIRALAYCVRHRGDVDWRLKVIGGGDWSEVRQLASDLGVLDRITFVPECSTAELYAALEESLCLVFTSIMEGFGLPPIEAMGMGCPVVAAASAAMPEVIGDAGILVRPCDADAFGQAILDFHDSPELRRKMIEAGFSRVKRFSWDDSGRAMYELFLKYSAKGAMGSMQLQSNADLYHYLVGLGDELRRKGESAAASEVTRASRFACGSSSEFFHEAMKALKSVQVKCKDVLTETQLADSAVAIEEIRKAFERIGGA